MGAVALRCQDHLSVGRLCPAATSSVAYQPQMTTQVRATKTGTRFFPRLLCDHRNTIRPHLVDPMESTCSSPGVAKPRVRIGRSIHAYPQTHGYVHIKYIRHMRIHAHMVTYNLVFPSGLLLPCFCLTLDVYLPRLFSQLSISIAIDVIENETFASK